MKHFSLLLFISLVLILLSKFYIPVSAQTQIISVSPNNVDLKIDDQKIALITIQSDSKVSAFDLKFRNSDSIEVLDFTDILGFNSAINGFDYKKVIEKIDGSDARISFIFTSSAQNLPDKINLYVKLKGTKKGQGLINLDEKNSQIIDGDGKELQISPLTLSFNINDTQSSQGFVENNQLPTNNYPSNAAVVNIRVKLAGANNSASNSVKTIAVITGRTGEGNYETLPQTFSLTSNKDGTYSGSVALPDFKDGNKYSIMLKADRYLLRRICNLNQQENAVGEYRCKTPDLTIRAGETNELDFSNVSLIPGDLGISDGVINGYDLSIVRNNLGKNTFAANALADLNYDDKVDTQDLEIIESMAKNSLRKAEQ